VTTALVEGLELIVLISVADNHCPAKQLQRAVDGRTDDDNSINLAPATSAGSSEFLSASSRFRRATRACSRVSNSARIPSRFRMASTISQCWHKSRKVPTDRWTRTAASRTRWERQTGASTLAGRRGATSGCVTNRAKRSESAR